MIVYTMYGKDLDTKDYLVATITHLVRRRPDFWNTDTYSVGLWWAQFPEKYPEDKSNWKPGICGEERECLVRGFDSWQEALAFVDKHIPDLPIRKETVHV